MNKPAILGFFSHHRNSRFQFLTGLTIIFLITSSFTNNAYPIDFGEKASDEINLSRSFESFLLIRQEVTVTGKVVDQTGMPLPGVNVIEKGTDNGTMTDFDGNYTITVSGPSAVLTYSYLGLQTVERTVGDLTSINVTLLESAESLDQVVVVGFGTQKKENLTGSVSSLQVDDIVSQPVSNPVQLLYGRVSGVQLEQTSGAPGSSSAITVRGPNINNSDPLIIIDGMQAGSLDEVSPSDIESFSVLKDAASASIYGARGANGVILVTTKSGRRNQLRITVNSSIGTIKPVDLPELLMGADYARAMNERELYQGSGTPVYSEEIISGIENGTLDPNYFANDNWFEELYQPALYSDHYVSVNGGSEKTRYLFSMRYNQQEGTLNGNSQIDNYNFRAKMDFDITDWLTLGTNISGNKSHLQSPLSDVGDYARQIIFKNALQPIRYSNGDFSAATSVDGVTLEPSGNEVFFAQLGENIRNDYNLNAQVNAKVKLLNGLTYEPAFLYRLTANFESLFNPTWELYDGPDRETVINDNQRNNLFKDAGYSNFYQVDNLLRYEKNVNSDNYLAFLLGHQVVVNDNNFNQFEVTVQDFANNTLRGIESGVASTVLATGNAPTERILQSFFGRLEYRLLEKYLLELNMRMDGGSQFPEESRYGYFPSASAGWRISEEDFMNSFEDEITDLKIRGSWGKLGSLNSLSLYPYQQTFDIGSDYIFGPDDNSLTDGAAVNELANSDLKWEETETINIGLDFELFRKFVFTADWYTRDTHDILLRLPIPITAGSLNPPFVNAGEVRNHGIEVSSSYYDLIGEDFSYNLNFNISTNTNKILDLPGLPSGEIILNDGRSILREGEPLYSYYGLLWDGIYQNQEEIDNGPTPLPGTLPGFRRYVDVDGDGEIDTDADRTIIGNSFPKYVFGFNSQFGYKGLDMSLTISGISKVDRVRPMTGNDAVQGNMLAVWENRWSPTNPSNEFPVIGSDRLFSSWNIEDGSYVRLKTLELGYSLPQSFIEKFNMNKFRVYVSGTNLFTITNFTEGYDPEQVRDDFRGTTYPLNQTFVFGINLVL